MYILTGGWGKSLGVFNYDTRVENKISTVFTQMHREKIKYPKEVQWGNNNL